MSELSAESSSEVIDATVADHPAETEMPRADHFWRRALGSGRLVVGGAILILIMGTCLASLPWSGREYSGKDEDGYDIGNPYFYNAQNSEWVLEPPQAHPIQRWFGTGSNGRSILMRCLFGGVVSLAIGLAAATVAVVVGVSVGLFAGYLGGWVDALLMRSVDVIYGLPYVLMIILFKVALEAPLTKLFNDSDSAANLVVLFLAIGLVSWLTMARVVRGQVLSLRSQPFIEAARAAGIPGYRIFLFHLLPNLAGPIIVYATLTIPQAILQESFLSFVGIGIKAPMPTWGSLAADARIDALDPNASKWWGLVFPCILLSVTLLSLNFLGDGLRDLLDPKREAAKV